MGAPPRSLHWPLAPPPPACCERRAHMARSWQGSPGSCPWAEGGRPAQKLCSPALCLLRAAHSQAKGRPLASRRDLLCGAVHAQSSRGIRLGQVSRRDCIPAELLPRPCPVSLPPCKVVPREHCSGTTRIGIRDSALPLGDLPPVFREGIDLELSHVLRLCQRDVSCRGASVSVLI